MTFQEVPSFTKRLLQTMSDESYLALQVALMQNPELGKVIKGSGGLRKVRWALPGRGKSGGVRVIYFYYVLGSTIIFLDLYAKNEKENLTTDEIRALRKILES